LLTSLTAVNLFQRARGNGGGTSLMWLGTAGAVTGCGVWSTHFIAMLAYTPGFPIRYDIATTVMSLIVAAVMTTAGFATALLGNRRSQAILGGAMVGFGIAAMHYMGMASLRIPAEIVWMPDLVIASIVLGVCFGAAALLVLTRGETYRASAGAAIFLTLAITSLHFVAMGAIGLIPQPATEPVGSLLSPVTLALSIASVTATLVIGGLIGAIFDRRSQHRLNIRNMQLDAALNNMGQGLCMFDADNRLQLWNESYLAMYRIAPGQIFEGCTVEQMFEARKTAGTIFRDLEQHAAQLQSEIRTRVPTSRINELTDGRLVNVTYQPMQNGGWVATHDDITERKQNEARIAYLALHDPATGLPNRAAMNKHFAQALSDASAGKRSFAIVRIDIDRFKDINEAYGQSIGDVVLLRLAKTLQAGGAGDFLARPGGDEFTVISMLEPEAGAVEKMCTRLSVLLDNVFEIDGVVVQARCSAGISIFPQDGLDAETLIAHADTALHRAQTAGRGTIQFFESTMDQQVKEKRMLHRDLGAAIEKGEFELYFQPQARSDGRIVGFEALVRWHHPQRGLVSPGVFIPLAEETDLIGPIDEWVLRESCREAATWTNPLSIAVNLSPVDFRRGDLSTTILAILIETGLDPKRLEIEITEGVLIADFSRAIALLGKIKALGVRIAMDDFGTGYSSLSYLQSFSFDKIKIDQTFVGKIGSNPHSAAIIRAILGLGRALDLPVIAEGVETEVQLAFLAAEGCAEVQGYLIGRPYPIQHYRDVVHETRPVAIAM
ncbi:MAG TPA: EAL domain-containing protein, partial [Bradyrhizobium sp.]